MKPVFRCGCRHAELLAVGPVRQQDGAACPEAACTRASQAESLRLTAPGGYRTKARCCPAATPGRKEAARAQITEKRNCRPIQPGRASEIICYIKNSCMCLRGLRKSPF
ncbi:hypothetical protein [Polaromonas sp. CG9_12]|nr:hypothetical protein [Polaromonas sp. CG9_12]